ncbi:MAG: hypothetical protein KGJ13_06865 [Patescibacteria group bacterium]|nr:hypothetical protein [Patescibacteria group bacterium]
MKRRIANLLFRWSVALGAQRVQVNIIKDPHLPAVATAVIQDDHFEETHAKELLAFLNTQAGKAVQVRLLKILSTIAINGSRDRTNTVHAAGVTAGWDECLRYIFSLSRVTGDQVTKTNDGQSHEDDATLLEQLSP